MVIRKEVRGETWEVEGKKSRDGQEVRGKKNELRRKSIDRNEREIIEREKMSQIRKGTEVKK